MQQFDFEPATKQGSKARIALIGGPGAGKTWTALQIAQGLDSRPGDIGVIDTDRRSARKYADVFTFRTIAMHTYDPADLTRASIAAAEQGVGCLIVDTWSPFWGGADGMLDKVGSHASNFEGWRHMRPVERQMFDALLGYPGHVIVNLRTKVEYVVEANDKGKMEPKRIGLKPEQRDGIEYEFDVVVDLDAGGSTARVSKTRCPELTGRTFVRPGVEFGETVQAWLDRAAAGDPLNPHEIRAWALQEPRELDELRERRDALDAAGQLDAVVYDRAGELVSVGVLLTNLAREVRRAAEAQAGRAV